LATRQPRRQSGVRPKGKSLVTKRSAFVGNRKTSVAIEAPFWEAVKEIAARKKLKIGELLAHIDKHRQTPNLSSAIRLYVLDHYRRLVEIGLKPRQGVKRHIRRS
jgi:predicted DNA-binding ribbon-helix-helix protein